MPKQWNVSMKDEKERVELKDGLHNGEIAEVKFIGEEDSKSGNPYFLWSIETSEGTLPVRTTLIKGKRWLLKQMLSACGIEANDDDPEKKYAFSESDVLGKPICIVVKNKESSFTGKNGDPVTVTKSEVVGIRKPEPEGSEKVKAKDLEIPF